LDLLPNQLKFHVNRSRGKFQGSRGGGLLETEPGIVHALLLFRAVELAR
jgi:hypothetical protein